MKVFITIISIIMLFPITLFSQLKVYADFPPFVKANNKLHFDLLFENPEVLTDKDIQIIFLFSTSCVVSVKDKKLKGELTSDPNFKLYNYLISKDSLLKSPIVSFDLSTDTPANRQYEFLVRSEHNEEIFHKKGSQSVIGIPKLELILENKPTKIRKNEVVIHKLLVSNKGTSLLTNIKLRVVGNKGILPLKTILNPSIVKENILDVEAIPIMQISESKNFLVSFQALNKGTWVVSIELFSDQTNDKIVKKLTFIVD